MHFLAIKIQNKIQKNIALCMTAPEVHTVDGLSVRGCMSVYVCSGWKTNLNSLCRCFSLILSPHKLHIATHIHQKKKKPNNE